jgi:hypothetical protein
MPEDAKPAGQQSIAPVQLKVSGRTLALIAGGGLAAGTLIVVGAIMPAEFNTDPLGIGRLTGIVRLWAPDAKSFAAGGDLKLSHSADTPRLAHTVDIPLGAAGWPEAALEYKVHMTAGQSVLYRWEALTLDGAAATVPVEFDQHGHDVVEEHVPETVVDYRKGRAVSDRGSMTAPLEGIFGWYFRNHAEDPVIIRLQVEGYYQLIPPGQPGNEFSIKPRETAVPDVAPQQ